MVRNLSTFPKEFNEIVDGIRSMRIRGAGKIAVSAVRALGYLARSSEAKEVRAFLEELDAANAALLSTRPTAVSLPNGLRYVMKAVLDGEKHGMDVKAIKSHTIRSVKEFIEEAGKAVDTIGVIGARRISDGEVLLTHCNSSAAISIIMRAWEAGKKLKVFVTESRPRYQGRITAKALGKAGIPVTLIVDSAARFYMAKIDKVISGADAIAANGAVVNKIGTSQLALAAHESRTRFFVAAETYQFSPETLFGELVAIEERNSNEVIPDNVLKRMRNVEVRNPVFDITPPEYIDLIVTERGIIPPQGALYIMREEFGLDLKEELARNQNPLKVEEED